MSKAQSSLPRAPLSSSFSPISHQPLSRAGFMVLKLPTSERKGCQAQTHFFSSHFSPVSTYAWLASVQFPHHSPEPPRKIIPEKSRSGNDEVALGSSASGPDSQLQTATPRAIRGRPSSATAPHTLPLTDGYGCPPPSSSKVALMPPHSRMPLKDLQAPPDGLLRISDNKNKSSIEISGPGLH